METNKYRNKIIWAIAVVACFAIFYMSKDRGNQNSYKVNELPSIGELVEQSTEKEDNNQQLEDNKEEEKNMENNETNEGGVITTESGLMYEVITMGDGAKPEATDVVEVHYHGTLLDGTVFDSSVQRGEKISFGLNQVISGWTEGLQLMPIGSKFKFTIPSDLAYGDRSPSPAIPAGSTLVFEVELFDIK